MTWYFQIQLKGSFIFVFRSQPQWEWRTATLK